MKDSDVEWIGEIPEDWEIVPVKRKFHNKKIIVGEDEVSYERLALTLNGVVKKSKLVSDGLQPEKFSTYQLLEKNELVLKLIDLENVKTSRVGYSNYTGIVSPVYITLNNPNETKFGYYYFINLWYQEIFNYMGMGVRSNLTATDLLNFPYVLVPSSQQQKIVDILDDKIGRIDQIISETQQSIEELKKYKQSVITEAVTKGLDKKAKMKDSGIEWIGEVPNHWNLKRIGNYFYQVKNKNIKLIETNLLSLSYGNIIRRDINSSEGLLPENFSGYNIIQAADIVLRMTDLQNDHKSLRTGYAKEKGIITSAYITIRTDFNEINSQYVQFLLHTFDVQKGFYGMGSGVRQNVNFDDIKKISIVMPNRIEQDTIVNFVVEKINHVDSIIQKKEQLILELTEYKKSLIYEYVTGKKEVG